MAPQQVGWWWLCRTFGCSHNISDSEYMAGLLSQYGYTLMPSEQRDTADLWLVNTCTVTTPPPTSHIACACFALSASQLPGSCVCCGTAVDLAQSVLSISETHAG